MTKHNLRALSYLCPPKYLNIALSLLPILIGSTTVTNQKPGGYPTPYIAQLPHKKNPQILPSKEVLNPPSFLRSFSTVTIK